MCDLIRRSDSGCDANGCVSQEDGTGDGIATAESVLPVIHGKAINLDLVPKLDLDDVCLDIPLGHTLVIGCGLEKSTS